MIVEPILSENLDFACAREARAGLLKKFYQRRKSAFFINPA